jgi:phosphoenolpyruvate---glycerone phosphotransferase subunit DhaL
LAAPQTGSRGADVSLDAALAELSDVLMSEIGGSMGPLYGMMFADMAETIAGQDQIDAALFGRMLRAGLDGVAGIGSATVGDKTLMDTLVPAVEPPMRLRSPTARALRRRSAG